MTRWFRIPPIVAVVLIVVVTVIVIGLSLERLKSVSDDPIALIITVVTFTILIVQVYKVMMTSRSRHFKRAFKELNNNRSRYSEWMRRYCWNTECGKTGDYLIIPDAIKNLAKDSERPRLISGKPNANCTSRPIMYEKKDHPTITKDWLDKLTEMPNVNQTYSSNVVRHCGLKIYNWGCIALKDVHVKNDQIVVEYYRSEYARYFDTCQYSAYRISRKISENVDVTDEVTSSKRDDNSYEREMLGVANDIRSKILKIESLEGEISSKKDDGVNGYEIAETGKTECFEKYGCDNRVSAIGVCALTVFYNVSTDDESEESSAYICIHHRGENVAEARNIVSLVPAGGLQLTADLDDVDPFANNTIREFEEEIMGRPEMVEPESYNYLEDSEECNEFMKVFFCTMGLDPLTLKPEVMTLLLVNCGNEAFKKYIHNMKPHLQLGSKVTRKDLMEIVSNKDKDKEGDITLDRLTENVLKRYENDKRAMPVFRQCMKYVRNHIDAVKEEFEGRSMEKA